MQYRYAKFIATHYLQSAGERNVRNFIMTRDEICLKARDLLSELMELNHLATSPKQRKEFKESRDYLERAANSGSDSALQLGSYHLAVVSSHIREVQEGKLKGEKIKQ
jgi:hypothetical protein